MSKQIGYRLLVKPYSFERRTLVYLPPMSAEEKGPVVLLFQQIGILFQSVEVENILKQVPPISLARFWIFPVFPGTTT